MAFTYLLVDGENIDATLGLSVLGRRPEPSERPRWDRVRTFVDQDCAQAQSPEASDVEYDEEQGAEEPTPIRSAHSAALFFLNASNGSLPMNFVQALLAMDYRPIPLSGVGPEKVVDIGIQRTLNAIADLPEGDVILASHDGDFIPQLERLLAAGRKVSVICFREYLNSHLAALQDCGLKVYDIEHDIHAFREPLPRVRIIPLAEFDPLQFI
ncbi:MAG: NYN domain-containing protein [Buchananella hordeovulneris]|nr:NYN domain-containing protein [Buchananella hordeovulneris]